MSTHLHYLLARLLMKSVESAPTCTPFYPQLGLIFANVHTAHCKLLSKLLGLGNISSVLLRKKMT